STTAGALASRRNVAAVAAVDRSNFLRITTAVKQTVTSTVSGDARSVLELANLDQGSDSVIGPMAENPVLNVFGTSRVNIPQRQLAVDARSSVYAITLSGLTVTPLAMVSPRPALAGAATALVDAASGSNKVAPGSFVYVNGSNLAASNSTTQVPP